MDIEKILYMYEDDYNPAIGPRAMVGEITDEQTQFGRPIYQTPSGEKVSEKSTTLFLNGNWMNVPSIHGGKSFNEDELRLMIKQGNIEPTSVHKSKDDAEAAAKARSDSMVPGPRNMYAGGQLVQPNADGSRPGYAGTKVEDNIRLRDNGNAYDVEIQRGPQTFRKSFNLKDYKNKTEALNAAKKFKSEKIKIPFKTGKQDPMFGSGLDKKEYQKLYHAKTRTLTEAGELAKERDLKLKNFIGNKKKINASTLRDFVIDELGYDNYSAGRIKQKFPNLEIVKDIKTGTKFTPLNKKQIEIVKENFDLPEGVEKWNFKQYKNGISAGKHPNLFAQIQRRLDDKTIYKVAANFSDPEGWMISAMNRLYENETVLKDGERVLKEGVDKLTYEPKFNKKGIIVGFKDNTAAGKGNIYYGTKKAAKNYGDGTDWRVHGDFGRVNKFLNIANGVRSEPNEILQKILNKKGLNIKGLTLNDVLSHQKYYDVLADTAPKALLKRQIVLHHTKGVGDQNVARAAATKDIQLLTDAINSKVMKLENIVKGTSITPGRKLTNAEKLKLKNYGAKITDFDGKVVGGGYTDPTKQFAAIEKKALEYAKGDQFNVKTVASYLERLGCGKAAGGRILFAEGVPSLTKCAKEGVKKLEKGLKSGFKNADDMSLAKNILKSGRFLKDAVSLRGLFGPAALAFTAAAEAGIVGYDMLASGKSFREAIGDSLFNYALGDKTKIDSDEEFIKRLKNIKVGPQGYQRMGDEQIGKMLNFKANLDDMQRGFSLYDKLQDVNKKIEDNTLNQAIDPSFFSDTAFQLDDQKDKIQADIRDYNKTGTTQRVTDYMLSDKATEGADASALANLLVRQDQLKDAGIGGALPKVDQGIARDLKQTTYDIENLLNPLKLDEFGEYFISRPQSEQSYIMGLGYKEGGIASLNVKK